MKISSKIIILVLTCCFESLICQSFAKDEPAKEVISEETIDLGSFDKPIVLDPNKFKKYDQVEYEQKEYIRKNYEDYELLGNSYTMDEGRFLFGFLLRNDQNKVKTVYFDMTGIYKKFGGNHKYRNTIKKLKEQYPPQPIN